MFVVCCCAFLLIMDEVDKLANTILEYERFIDIQNTHQFVENSKNLNTKRATEGHIRLFRAWLQATNHDQRNPEEIPGTELDNLLARFFLGIRKQSSDPSKSIDDVSIEYEPITLRSIHSSIHRYLTDHNYDHNIKESMIFQHSRQVLLAKLKQLKQLGKGNKPNSSQPFTSDDLLIMRSKNIIGSGKFTSLIFLTNLHDHVILKALIYFKSPVSQILDLTLTRLLMVSFGVTLTRLCLRQTNCFSN